MVKMGLKIILNILYLVQENRDFISITWSKLVGYFEINLLGCQFPVAYPNLQC